MGACEIAAYGFQPANAFLLLDRHTSRIDAALQSVRSVESIPVPELNCSQTEWQSIPSDHETGMHQDAAGGVIFAGVA